MVRSQNGDRVRFGAGEWIGLLAVLVTVVGTVLATWNDLSGRMRVVETRQEYTEARLTRLESHEKP